MYMQELHCQQKGSNDSNCKLHQRNYSQKWHLNTKMSLVSFTGSMMLFSKINTVYRKEEVMSFSSQF